MSAPDGWDGILDDDEAILWQGRPNAAVRWTWAQVVTSIFGAVFAGFAVFWMILASDAGGAFWMFGLIHFGAGLALMVGPPFWNAWSRKHTWYTLTSRRAFIATDIPLQGRRLKSYSIDPSTQLRLDSGAPGSVYFAEEFRRTKNGSRRIDIGFERIADAEDVFRRMREIQRKAA